MSSVVNRIRRDGGEVVLVSVRALGQEATGESDVVVFHGAQDETRESSTNVNSPQQQMDQTENRTPPTKVN